MTDRIEYKFRKLGRELINNTQSSCSDKYLRLKKYDSLAKEMEELLEEDFKEQVIDLWEYDLDESYSRERERKLIKEGTKIDFICEYHHSSDKRSFLEENWDNIDDIINVLREYIKLLEVRDSAKSTKEIEKEIEDNERRKTL